MKTKIKVLDLNNVLSKIDRVVLKSGSGHHFNKIVFSFGKEESYATAGNGSIQIKHKLNNISVDEECMFMVDFIKLSRVVKTLPKDKYITLNVKDNKLKTSCSKSRSTLSVLETKHYPFMSCDDVSFNLIEKDMVENISLVSHAAAKGNIQRRNLNGVAFTGDGETMDISASDMFRIAITSVKSTFKGSAIIPTGSIDLFKQLASSSDRFGVSNGKLLIESKDFQAIFGLLDMQPIAYRKAIPNEDTLITELKFSKENILDSLKRVVAVVDDPQKGYCVVQSSKGDSESILTGVVRYSSDRVEEALPTNNSNKDVECSFNPYFLLDMLSSIDEDTINIGVYSSVGSPLVYHGDSSVLILSQIVV